MPATTWNLRPDHWISRECKSATFRAASADEIVAAQANGGHVFFGCECGHAAWMAKGIALSNSGRYTGTRSLFYQGDDPECDCPSSRLTMMVPA